MKSHAFDLESWPVAGAALAFGSFDHQGQAIHDADPDDWARDLRRLRRQGFTELDPTDTWVRVGDLSPGRLYEFKAVVEALGFTVPAVSTSRRSVMDPLHGKDYLSYGHRVLDAAAELGAGIVGFGFFQSLTSAQQKELWFWNADGWKDDETPEVRAEAVAMIRELAEHAEQNGQQISLEMYEDTYIGTPDRALQFLRDVDHPACGLNPDIGNLVRLHRPLDEPIPEMLSRLLPHSNFWHIKNYLRDEDPQTGHVSTHPAPLDTGVINYRWAIEHALDAGFTGPLLCEHYGGDSLSVLGRNLAYVRQILAELREEVLTGAGEEFLDGRG